MKYTVFRGKVIELEQGSDGLWRDSSGAVFALRDDSTSADLVDQCGVAPFSVNADSWANEACRQHDYKYSSPAYQLFHTRAEADQELRDAIAADKSLWRFAAWPFFFFAKVFGGQFWENKSTDV